MEGHRRWDPKAFGFVLKRHHGNREGGRGGAGGGRKGSLRERQMGLHQWLLRKRSIPMGPMLPCPYPFPSEVWICGSATGGGPHPSCPTPRVTNEIDSLGGGLGTGRGDVHKAQREDENNALSNPYCRTLSVIPHSSPVVTCHDQSHHYPFNRALSHHSLSVSVCVIRYRGISKSRVGCKSMASGPTHRP